MRPHSTYIRNRTPKPRGGPQNFTDSEYPSAGDPNREHQTLPNPIEKGTSERISAKKVRL